MVPTTVENSKLSLENQIAQRRIEWLEQDLATKDALILDLKRNHSEEALDLKSRLSVAEESQRRLEASLSSVREEYDVLRKMHEELAQKSRVLSHERAEAELQWENEVRTGQKLVELLKEGKDEARGLVDKLTDEVKDLQQKLDEQIETDAKEREALVLEAEKQLDELKSVADNERQKLVKDAADYKAQLDVAEQRLREILGTGRIDNSTFTAVAIPVRSLRMTLL